MSSREKILQAVQNNQPTLLQHPGSYVPSPTINDLVEQFKNILQTIGGNVVVLNNGQSITSKIKELFPSAVHVLSTLQQVQEYYQPHQPTQLGQALESIEVAIMEGVFGVAENGAVWLTEAQSKYRVLPFIAEHLVVVLSSKNMVATMHHAYDRIGTENYDFGVFIAGPSKTADIEQSLVLGAHGPKTMTVIMEG